MWSISDSGACYSGSSGESLGQTGILTVGEKYLVSISLINTTKGKISFDSFGLGENEISEDGVYQLSGIATIPDISVTALDYAGFSFDGCIELLYVVNAPVINVVNSCTNEVVYEVPYTDMTIYKGYIKIVIPWDFQNANYFIQIQDDNLTYNSGCFKVDLHECTLLLSWTNDDNGYNIDYENLNLINKLRVYGKLWNVRPNTDRETFTDSRGFEKIIYASTKMTQDVTIKEVVDYTTRAIGIGTNHDHFYIDGNEFFVEDTEIDPNWRKSSISAPIVLKVRKQNVPLINRNCK